MVWREKGGRRAHSISACLQASLCTPQNKNIRNVKVIEVEIPPMRIRRGVGIYDLARPPGTGPLEEQ